MKEDAKNLVATRLSSAMGADGVIGNHSDVSDMIVCILSRDLNSILTKYQYTYQVSVC